MAEIKNSFFQKQYLLIGLALAVFLIILIFLLADESLGALKPGVGGCSETRQVCGLREETVGEFVPGICYPSLACRKVVEENDNFVKVLNIFGLFCRPTSCLHLEFKKVWTNECELELVPVSCPSGSGSGSGGGGGGSPAPPTPAPATKDKNSSGQPIDWDKVFEELNKSDTGGGGAGTSGDTGNTQCSDGKDNDNDGKIDNGVTKDGKSYPPDSGCQDKDGKYDPNDRSEFQYRIKETIPWTW